jgi:guanine nucleotide-binding protein subunit beta-2-like 1 protein
MAAKTFYLASGSKDGQAMIWNLIEGKFLGKIDCGTPINAVLFSSKKYWIVMGTEQGIKVWDLPKKTIVCELAAEPLDPALKTMKKPISCTSLAWNKNGNLLFSGWSDNYIRVYKIVSPSK